MGSPDTTRLLVLGVTSIFEPANGYQLRRELLSWDVEDWANIAPGSIYSMLTTFTKGGLVERFDLVLGDGARPVAVYRTTEAGRAELGELVRRGIREVNGFDSGLSYAALNIMVGVLTRDEVLPLLELRQEALLSGVAGLAEKTAAIESSPGTPPHVGRLIEYAARMHDAELAWLREFTDDVRAGKFVFLGEPAHDAWGTEQYARLDPAWRMVDEQALYRQAIAELEG